MKKYLIIYKCFGLLIMMLFVVSCNKQGTVNPVLEDAKVTERMEFAKTKPFVKYPVPITYTLGKMTGVNRSNMPSEDTYENNLYTRYLNKILNIQNVNVFEEAGDHYDNMVAMAVSERKLPDIMIVGDPNVLNSLVENDMIADLTEAYRDCASERIKEMYDSYKGRALDMVTFNDKIMAVPGVNIEYGPNLLWLRKDWLEKLSLKAPSTLEDVEMILKEFMVQNPGNNREGETIGMVCGIELTGNYDLEYQMDLVFASYGAFPGNWIYDEDGSVVYGSVTEKSGRALQYLHRWYEEGILDNQFLMRSTDNIHELIIQGKCGAFFGPWWAPNNPLMQSYAKDKEAKWEPFVISTGDGSCTTYEHPISNKYVVVRKGFEHPELVVKMISVLFDYERFIDNDSPEIKKIYEANLDPTARPIVINIDYNDAYLRSSNVIQAVLNGELPLDDLTTLEKSYYELCNSFLEKDIVKPEEWAAYTSRITAANLLNQTDVVYQKIAFYGRTETMRAKWWSLQQLEHNAYLKIITGAEPVEYFERFVKEWKEQGGDIITKEVNEYTKNNS